MQAFPTEAANEINVVFAKITTSKTQLIVVDVTEKECLRTELALGQSEYTVDVSSLAAGQFFLRIQSETGIEVAKFMKL